LLQRLGAESFLLLCASVYLLFLILYTVSTFYKSRVLVLKRFIVEKEQMRLFFTSNSAVLAGGAKILFSPQGCMGILGSRYATACFVCWSQDVLLRLLVALDVLLRLLVALDVLLCLLVVLNVYFVYWLR